MSRSTAHLLCCLAALLLLGCEKASVPTLPSNPLLAQPVPAHSVMVLIVWRRLSPSENCKHVRCCVMWGVCCKCRMGRWIKSAN